MCKPMCDQSDNSVCKYMMFVMVDVLRYLGFLDATMPIHQHRLLTYKQKVLGEAHEQLKTLF